MAIKTYGMVRSFETGELDENGNAEKIIFKASGNLLILYKEYTGKDLMQQFMAFAKTNEKAIKNTGLTIDEFNALTDEQKMSHNLEDAEIDATFMNNCILCMRLNAIPENERDEAMSEGLDILPVNFYMDINIINELMGLILMFVKTIDKKKIQ